MPAPSLPSCRLPPSLSPSPSSNAVTPSHRHLPRLLSLPFLLHRLCRVGTPVAVSSSTAPPSSPSLLPRLHLRSSSRPPPPLLSLSSLSLCCRRYRRTPETPPPPLSSLTTAPTVDLLRRPQEKLQSPSSSPAPPLLPSVAGTSVAVAISSDPRGSPLPNFAAGLFSPIFSSSAPARSRSRCRSRCLHPSSQASPSSSSAVATSLPSLSLLRRGSHPPLASSSSSPSPLSPLPSSR